jgi:hypothetical protein
MNKLFMKSGPVFQVHYTQYMDDLPASKGIPNAVLCLPSLNSQTQRVLSQARPSMPNTRRSVARPFAVPLYRPSDATSPSL